MPRSRNFRSLLSLLVAAPAFIVGCTTSGSGEASWHAREREMEREGEHAPDQPSEAMAFRAMQRRSADGTTPENALLRAKAQRDALVSADVAGAGLTSASWTSLGPGNIGGRIRGLVIHPTQTSTIWIGSASGGIWKTTNGGTTWTALDDFLPSLAVGCLRMHPTDPNTLYAGTGEGFFDNPTGESNATPIRGAGIFRTTDGGATWTQLPATANADFYFVNELAIDPANPAIFLAATQSGLFRSTDSGATWSRTFTGRALDITIDPFNHNNVLASFYRDTQSTLYSSDNGQTWQRASGIPAYDRTEFAFAPNTSSLVFAGVSINGTLYLYKSVDAGRTWTRSSNTGANVYGPYNIAPWIDPTNPTLIVMGGTYLSRSTNGGASFSDAYSSVHPDVHLIVNDPGYNGSTNKRIYIACDGGIYRADNASTNSAVELNNGLGITQFYGVAVADSTGRVVGGTQDNGTLRYKGNSEAWADYAGGDGGYNQNDPTAPNVFYGEYQWGDIHRSDDGGESVAAFISGGISDTGDTNTNFITPILLDPNSPSRMLVGCRRLWRTSNARVGSPSWTAIKPPIGQGRDQSGTHIDSLFNISAIALPLGNSDLIYVGYNNGQVWYTTNGTAAAPTWTRIDTLGSGLPARWVADIIIDPADQNRIYVAYMGYEADNLWVTKAPFSSWTRITGTPPYALPAAPASALAVHRTIPGWLYVGTDVGVFTSTDDGNTWSTTAGGPAAASVERLAWRNGNTLMAATYGRGMWQASIDPGLKLGDPVPGIAGQNNTLTASNATSGQRVTFVAGFRTGNVTVPGCAVFVGISQPIILGSTLADGNGDAALTAPVPGSVAGREILMQAVEQSTCRVSPLVRYTFN